MNDPEIHLINEEFRAGSVEPEQLDVLLAGGWRHFGTRFYRYSLNIYQDQIVRVMPLRIRLADFRLSKSQRRILRRNQDLECTVGPIEITDDTHELFASHKQRFTTDVPPSIYTFLSTDPANVPCPALETSVKLDGKLVAASFFDIGTDSISSIYGIFDPHETVRSLGIYTMLKEIEWAVDNGRQYYYPGYAYDGESFYDYKKRFSALERFDWYGNWVDFTELMPLAIPWTLE
jgi:arginine-tRNA-protein transferase